MDHGMLKMSIKPKRNQKELIAFEHRVNQYIQTVTLDFLLKNLCTELLFIYNRMNTTS